MVRRGTPGGLGVLDTSHEENDVDTQEKIETIIIEKQAAEIRRLRALMKMSGKIWATMLEEAREENETG